MSPILLKALFAFTAVIILVNGLDDLFIDIFYYIPILLRRRWMRKRIRPLTEKALRAKPEQRIAIMIPAWREHAVIGRMLRNTIATVDYGRYDLFVGAYPNDEATKEAVAEAAFENKRVHLVVCPHDGPTNKSDCLNWIIAGIRIFEKDHGAQFDIFMLHDAEDLVHPLSFRLVNHLVPRFQMVQLPVIPIVRPFWKMTAGTYLDEFSQSHNKDLLVREILSGMVPGAGVGTAFSRRTFERLGHAYRNQIFNIATYTEDYDLAFRIHRLDKRSIILQYFVERPHVDAPTFWRRKPRVRMVRELVATREYFPDRIASAVRQKARWTLGIVFHGWRELGWSGPPMVRYMLWRDRKVILTNFVDLLGYTLLVAAALGIANFRDAQGRRLFLAPSGSWLWSIIVFDAFILLNRFAQRAIAVYRVAGAWQALWSAPRMLWGNIINCAAVLRATRLFIVSELTGKKPTWSKTEHAFPTEAQLRSYRRKLGDLLLERRLVTVRQLKEASALQKRHGSSLAETIISMGYVTQEQIQDLLNAGAV